VSWGFDRVGVPATPSMTSAGRKLLMATAKCIVGEDRTRLFEVYGYTFMGRKPG